MRGWWHAAGAEKTVCAGGACLAAVPGPSTSPLGVVLEAVASFLAVVGLPLALWTVCQTGNAS